MNDIMENFLSTKDIILKNLYIKTQVFKLMIFRKHAAE